MVLENQVQVVTVPHDPEQRRRLEAEVIQWKYPWLLLVPEGTRLLPTAREILLEHLHPNVAGVYGVTQTVNAEGNPLPFDPLPERIRDRRGIRGAQVVPWTGATTFDCFVYRDPIGPGPVLLRNSVLDYDRLLFRNEAGGDWWWEFTTGLSVRRGLRFVDEIVATIPEPPEEEDARRRMRMRQTRQWIAEIDGLSRSQRTLAELCLKVGRFIDG